MLEWVEGQDFAGMGAICFALGMGLGYILEVLICALAASEGNPDRSCPLF